MPISYDLQLTIIADYLEELVYELIFERKINEKWMFIPTSWLYYQEGLNPKLLKSEIKRDVIDDGNKLEEKSSDHQLRLLNE